MLTAEEKRKEKEKEWKNIQPPMENIQNRKKSTRKESEMAPVRRKHRKNVSKYSFKLYRCQT